MKFELRLIDWLKGKSSAPSTFW